VSEQATKHTGPVAGARGPTRLTDAYRRRLSRHRTRKLLERHLLVMSVAAVVAVSALLVSYREVVLGADDLRSRAAPAVQGVAAARLALLRADWEARQLEQGPLDGVAGAGEAYRTQLSAADQGLSRLADKTSDDLGAVNGVLASYGNSITLGVVRYHDDELMQQQKFEEAGLLLTRSKTGLIPRLDKQQKREMREAGQLASMDALGYTGWAVAELALLVLGLTLLSALWVLRDRCGRDCNLWLLGALLLTVALAVGPPIAATVTQDRLDSAHDKLVEIRSEAEQHERPEKFDPTQGADLDAAQNTVSKTSDAVRKELVGAEWQSWVYYGAFGGGVLVAALPLVGLGRRLNADYWRAR
jgi:hypothetical protein